MSLDGSIFVAGFNDSLIKVFEYDALRRKVTPATTQDEMREAKEKLPPPKETKLIGHSGPVYGVSLSWDKKFLLSCSYDHSSKSALLKKCSSSLVNAVIEDHRCLQGTHFPSMGCAILSCRLLLRIRLKRPHGRDLVHELRYTSAALRGTPLRRRDGPMAPELPLHRDRIIRQNNSNVSSPSEFAGGL